MLPLVYSLFFLAGRLLLHCCVSRYVAPALAHDSVPIERAPSSAALWNLKIETAMLVIASS